MSDNSFFWGQENDFQKQKIIFSYPHNELLDLNKTYINISKGQKFELYKIEIFRKQNVNNLSLCVPIQDDLIYGWPSNRNLT